MLNNGYAFQLVIDAKGLGHTTLTYLVTNFPHSTQSEWQIRCHLGEVRLNGTCAHGAELLKPGMKLVWNRPAWFEPETPQCYSVIYQDAQLLVVEKPSGLPTLPGAGFHVNTLLNFVRRDFPTASPIHRLGRTTSGLVLFAVDSVVASVLSQQWPDIQKQYQALASGIASSDWYDIRQPIGRVEHPRLGTVHAASSNGKSAHSVARPVERRNNSTVFEVDLHSGRPHQIRIHLASIGYPLVGDPLYASGGKPKSIEPGLPGDAGYWLHAKRLVLKHPTTELQLDFRSPLPEILRESNRK